MNVYRNQAANECIEYCLDCWEFINLCQCHSDDGRDYDLDPEMPELPIDPLQSDEPVKSKKRRVRHIL